MVRKVLVSLSALVVLACLASAAPTSSHVPKTEDKPIFETKWFEQPVDHFSMSNTDTLMQRYLISIENWCNNCPILFYTGNQSNIDSFANTTGWMWESAKELRAMIVFVEHRFYGWSKQYDLDPTRVQAENPRYLNSEQALADFAKLASAFKNTVFEAKYSPIITVGGGYGGMLASWMRMKYPDLVAGALASSAPVLKFAKDNKCEAVMQELEATSNIIFSSGSLDAAAVDCPREGVESRQIHTIKVAGASGSDDLRTSRPNDAAQLKRARHQELDIITNWIQQHYDGLRKSVAKDLVVAFNRTVQA